MSYLDQQRLELLKELESGDITEAEYWEYYNDSIAESSEIYADEYFATHENNCCAVGRMSL